MKKIIRRMMIALLVGALMGCTLPFSPPSPSAYLPTVATLPSGEDCLVGTFELNDFGDAVASLLPKTVEYTNTTGRMTWTFTAGGIIEASADHFTLAFQMKNDPSIGITVLMNGTARRFYKLSGPDQITFWNADDSQFTWSETVGGISMPVDAMFKLLAPLPPSDGTMSYKCEILSLTIYPSVAGAKPLGLTKTGP